MRRQSSFIYVFMAAAVATIMACSTENKAETEQTGSALEITRSEMTSTSGGEKYVATLTIDGMGCAMACGSKISGTLAGLEGVSQSDINFVGAGEANTAIVEFDNSKITEAELIRAINEMKGGHYSVEAVHVVHYTPKVAPQGQAEENDSNSKVSFKPQLQYKLPNVFSIFSRLF